MRAELIVSSGIHHLEEIREAGLEIPSVNQIEVYTSATFVTQRRD